MNLQNLSTEILLQIFEYCSIQDLGRLQQTCKRFYEIIYWSTTLGSSILVTNQVQQSIRDRCKEILTVKEKFRISNNWKGGVYSERSFLRKGKKYIPWIVLTKDFVWVSRGRTLYKLQRRKRYLDVRKNVVNEINIPVAADVCKFIVKDNSCLICGLEDGGIFVWKFANYSHYQICHQSDVHSIDVNRNFMVSGSKDNTVKLWSLSTELEKPYNHVDTYKLNDRVWSVAVSKDNQHFSAGTARNTDDPPLYIFDVNQKTVIQTLGENLADGSGILHMKWESPQRLLSCGYDKNIRMWDLRTNTCVQSWEDPFYSTVYCFDTDNHCTILSGTQTYGRVVLWDMRMKSYIQMYYLETCKSPHSSPVYGLSFDASSLFCVTDRNVNVLNFGIVPNLSASKVRNYSFSSIWTSLPRV